MSAPATPFAELIERQGVGACCAELYQAPAVRWLLDGRLHPGGERLTLRGAELAGVGPGSRVLDVASGDGATVLLLARETGARVVGVELGEGAVAGARAAAAEAGLDGQVSFQTGDATALPLPDASIDALLCECSLCLFEDKPRAVSEMARVLRPAGRVAIADVTADRERLPAPLRSVAARVACVGDALPLEGYERLLEAAGLQVEHVERHDEALAAMADRVDARLRAARMLRVPDLEPYRPGLEAAVELSRLAQEAIAHGTLGYALVVARKDRPGAPGG
jgi:arsenite methyltransferase